MSNSNLVTESALAAAYAKGQKAGQIEGWKPIGNDPIGAAEKAGIRSGKAAVAKEFRDLCGFTKERKLALAAEVKAEMNRRVTAQLARVASGDEARDA